jgi:tellurite resistance protein TerC
MIIWIGFLFIILFFLALDLGVFHKESHQVTTKEAWRWTSVWVLISLAFSGAIYVIYKEGWIANPNELSSQQAVLKYLTGYIVELSLSMDNIFVIAIIFAYFKVPNIYQHRVLFWGILGAIFFRAIMILLGVILINKFAWVSFLFGGLLLYSAYKMLTSGDIEIEPKKNPLVRWVKKLFPVTKDFAGDRFFVQRKHMRAATPLFIALVMVETTDILFAVDSIPAVLAITIDPFLVFSSNIFAVLGLRSLYFVLASMLEKFKFLKYSLVFILAFVGAKMLLLQYVHLPEWLSLTVILLALLAGILTSIVPRRKETFET